MLVEHKLNTHPHLKRANATAMSNHFGGNSGGLNPALESACSKMYERVRFYWLLAWAFQLPKQSGIRIESWQHSSQLWLLRVSRCLLQISYRDCLVNAEYHDVREKVRFDSHIIPKCPFLNCISAWWSNGGWLKIYKHQPNHQLAVYWWLLMC